MKDYYWQNYFKKIFLLSSFLLLALNSSSLYSGGDSEDDKNLGGGKEKGTVKSSGYAIGAYEDADFNHTRTKLMGGRIQGSFNVDGSSGSSQYSIPIIVPSGHAGMEPKLQLAYSSGGGNGHYGVGWELVGLPTVHRCGTNKKLDSDVLFGKWLKKKEVTKYRMVNSSCRRRNWWGACIVYNQVKQSYTVIEKVPMKDYEVNRGVKNPIGRKEFDKLCYGGARLVLTEGEYGKEGSKYQVANDRHTTAELNGNSCNLDIHGLKNCKMHVTKPNGSIETFKQESDRRSMHLESIYDTSNNYMHVTWWNWGRNETLLKEIKYTGTSKIGPKIKNTNPGPIWGQYEAPEKCNESCEKNGGKWNGQWWSKSGTSYCQCDQTVYPPSPALTLEEALSLNGWRTNVELENMSRPDKRNTLIVELKKITPYEVTELQAFNNDKLLEMVNLHNRFLERGWRTEADLKEMSNEDRRNTMIVELQKISTFETSELQGFDNNNLLNKEYEAEIDGNPPTRRVKFHWRVRTDKKNQYFGGQQINMHHIIDKISVDSLDDDWETLTEYRFNFRKGYSTKRNTLRWVQMCGKSFKDEGGSGNMVCLPETSFKYTDGASTGPFAGGESGVWTEFGTMGNESPTKKNSDEETPLQMVGDVNGDGLGDLIWIVSGGGTDPLVRRVNDDGSSLGKAKFT